MAFSDLKQAFENQEKEYGCKYAAVNAIAKRARSKLSEVNNHCNISDAIRWATTGEEPDISINEAVIQKMRSQSYQDIIDQVLDDVDDEDTRRAVLASIADSRYEGHLIYNYKEIEDERKKARVRILTRMIFYSIYKKS